MRGGLGTSLATFHFGPPAELRSRSQLGSALPLPSGPNTDRMPVLNSIARAFRAVDLPMQPDISHVAGMDFHGPLNPA